MDYKTAGVDLKNAQRTADIFADILPSTHNDQVISCRNAFAGAYDLGKYMKKYRNPVLLTSSDGVGTKMKLACYYKQFDNIGIDLVAMSVNDVLAQGGCPIMFQDYIGSNSLDLETVAKIGNSMSRGCKEAKVAFMGGETAEMPGFYSDGFYDLSGFCVGIVDRDSLLPRCEIRHGDQMIGLASNGVHANGYAMINAILETLTGEKGSLPTSEILAELLKPTRIYVCPLMPLLEDGLVLALSHITGGGLADNVVRILPAKHNAYIDISSWEVPAIFRWIAKQGCVPESEMLKVFNCGIGMVCVTTREHCEEVIKITGEQGLRAFNIGEIRASKHQTPQVIFQNKLGLKTVTSHF